MTCFRTCFILVNLPRDSSKSVETSQKLVLRVELAYELGHISVIFAIQQHDAQHIRTVNLFRNNILRNRCSVRQVYACAPEPQNWSKLTKTCSGSIKPFEDLSKTFLNLSGWPTEAYYNFLQLVKTCCNWSTTYYKLLKSFRWFRRL